MPMSDVTGGLAGKVARLQGEFDSIQERSDAFADFKSALDAKFEKIEETQSEQAAQIFGLSVDLQKAKDSIASLEAAKGLPEVPAGSEF